jgi:hypothetical protein
MQFKYRGASSLTKCGPITILLPSKPVILALLLVVDLHQRSPLVPFRSLHRIIIHRIGNQIKVRIWETVVWAETSSGQYRSCQTDGQGLIPRRGCNWLRRRRASRGLLWLALQSTQVLGHAEKGAPFCRLHVSASAHLARSAAQTWFLDRTVRNMPKP